jgi:anthranilate phosphoribosyltransferase
MKIKQIFKGEINEFSVAVALNVAAGLIVSGKEYYFIDAFNKASKQLFSGNVFQHLIKLQSK